MTPPRFAVDKMLGRLATWLRVLGFDATYGSHLSGLTLIRHARNEKRLLLTRAHKLSRHLDLPPMIFIRSDRFRDQVQQLSEALELTSLARPLSRCLHCNIEIAATDLQSTLPDATAPRVGSVNHLARCRGCDRVFWSAHHRQRLSTEVQAMGFLHPSGVNPGQAVGGPSKLD